MNSVFYFFLIGLPLAFAGGFFAFGIVKQPAFSRTVPTLWEFSLGIANRVGFLRNLGIFGGVEPPKLLGEHPAGVFPKPFSSRGETLVSPLNPLCAC